MKLLRIAFGCQARVGKDTACEHLQKEHGGEIHHFADPLYDILYYAQKTCGFPQEKDRKFLQWVGTEWARSQKDSVWVDTLLKKIPENENCYVGDVRFPNELAALQSSGFYCIRIVRSNSSIDTHASETALANNNQWDMIIENNGTVEEFYRKIDEVVKDFKDKHKTIQNE